MLDLFRRRGTISSPVSEQNHNHLMLCGQRLLSLALCWLTGQALAFSTQEGRIWGRTCLFARRPPRTPRGRPKPPAQKKQRRPIAVDEVAFDAESLTAAQDPNEGASRMDLIRSGLRPMDGNGGLDAADGALRIAELDEQESESQDGDGEPLFRFYSLDDVSGMEGFSKLFNKDERFRSSLRAALREDVLDSTPYYQSMSQAGRDILRQPDSSLEGSWKGEDGRMKNLSDVIVAAGLSSDPNAGDVLLNSIGRICGPHASTHWIDIVGVLDRKIRHSWHQDCRYSRCSDFPTTVLWGFPPSDNYVGTGVFSHVVPLASSSRVVMDADGSVPIRRQPVVYEGSFDEAAHVVRPCYRPGGELLVYRDFDVLHSSPDVAYRTSVMRFM